MDGATCSHPGLLGDNSLIGSSGRLYRVLPMLALICLVLGPSLQALLFARRGLRSWISWALSFGYSTRPFSASTWLFSERLDLWLRSNNLVSASIGRHCHICRRTPSWGWWALFLQGWLLLCHMLGWRASLLLGFMLWFCKPIERLVIPRAMLPLPPLIGFWWSLAMVDPLLPSVHWLEDVLEMNTCFWCQGLNKTI